MRYRPWRGKKMTALEFLRSHALAMPNLAKFAIGMAIIVGVPPLSRRARLPAVVGLLLSGVVLGPHGLDVIGQNRPIADFFAELGKLLLMFFAGLEIDLTRFRQAQRRTMIFGLLTTTFPQVLGYGHGTAPRLRTARSSGPGFAARIAHAPRRSDRSPAWRCRARADHHHLRGNRDLGYAVLAGVCHLPRHLPKRLYLVGAHRAGRRDRRLRAAHPFWPEPAGSASPRKI